MHGTIRGKTFERSSLGAQVRLKTVVEARGTTLLVSLARGTVRHDEPRQERDDE
jgi:hypothetical protein